MKSEFCFCDWCQFLTVTLSTLFSFESEVLQEVTCLFDSIAGGTEQQHVSKQKIYSKNLYSSIEKIKIYLFRQGNHNYAVVTY